MDRQGKVLLNRKLANQSVGIQLLVRASLSAAEQQGIVEIHAAIESCTGAANLADELINTAGWSVTLAHPGIVSRMKQNPDKSDHTDAFVLADLKRIGYLPKVWLAPEEVRQLRSLVRHRAQLVKQRTRIKLRIRALLREHRVSPPVGVRPWTQLWLEKKLIAQAGGCRSGESRQSRLAGGADPGGSAIDVVQSPLEQVCRATQTERKAA